MTSSAQDYVPDVVIIGGGLIVLSTALALRHTSMRYNYLPIDAFSIDRFKQNRSNKAA